jgi:crotonobetaine/carnitine-CoA ligase
MDEVSEAAVVGKPHPLLNEAPVAFVVPTRRSAGLEAKIMDRCASLLADFKRPVAVILVDDLPRSLLNKVAKRELRARLIEREGA